MPKGIARLDRRTKNLVKRLQRNDIAIIDHQDLDETAAYSLLRSGVSVVINQASFISGRYPNPGPGILEQGGVYLVEETGEDLFNHVQEGDELEVEGGEIRRGGESLAQGKVLVREEIEARLEQARENLNHELESFLKNTFEYAQREKELVLGGIYFPELRTRIEGRHALVVVRGKDYREDLAAIRGYIRELRPVLIGVDGGADALREVGLRPDLIVGDMDSVSDEALQSDAELIVHGYPDGGAPGWERLERLGVTGRAVVVAAPGTSEDLAMLLADEKKAELLVAVGTHSGMIDFLEKGRAGMASTLLVRMKLGSHLVDAKGVSRLYQGKIGLRDLVYLVGAALLPMVLVLFLAPSTRYLIKVLEMKIRISLGL